MKALCFEYVNSEEVVSSLQMKHGGIIIISTLNCIIHLGMIYAYMQGDNFIGHSFIATSG